MARTNIVEVSQESDLASQFGYSRIKQVAINGQRYRLYTVPVRIWPETAGSGASQAAFIVGAVLSDKDFFKQARSPLGPEVIKITLLLLLALLAAHPILRYRLLNKSEIVHREEGLIFVLQMTITAALIAGGFAFFIWAITITTTVNSSA